MQEVYKFLKECEAYFLSTDDNGQPRVRPFSTIDLFEGKLYIQTGRTKDVSKQLAENPRIEICAYSGGTCLRIQAVAVDDDRREAKQHMLDSFPSLKEMYSADDGNTQVLYLKDAVANFSSFSSPPKTVKFQVL